MHRLPRYLLIACCSATIALAGCGGSKTTDEDRVKATVVDYYKAFAAGDGETACNHLADAAREELERASGGKECPKVVDAALKRPEYARVAKDLSGVKVSDVKVSGNTAIAVAEVPGLKASDGKTAVSTSVPLLKEENTWKIASPLGQG
jgi:hypothetical protein